jgi:esterase
VVFIHGLLGSSLNFRTLCRKPEISGPRDAYSVDLRNHGASPHDPDVSSEAMAADIALFLQQRGIPRAHIVGHSLGGRVAMATALLYPERVERLVVVDIAPVDYSGSTGAEVTQSSLSVLRAMKRLDLESLSRDRADRARVDVALAEQPGMRDPFIRGFVMQNCVQDGGPGGPWRWRVGLHELLAGYHSSLMAWPFAGASIPHETLFVGGADSAYLRGHEDACLRLCTHAHLQMFDGTGHYVHSEKPAEFAAAVAPFLSGGWTQHVDPATGRAFFFQAATSTSQWDAPA